MKKAKEPSVATLKRRLSLANELIEVQVRALEQTKRALAEFGRGYSELRGFVESACRQNPQLRAAREAMFPGETTRMAQLARSKGGSTRLSRSEIRTAKARALEALPPGAVIAGSIVPYGSCSSVDLKTGAIYGLPAPCGWWRPKKL